jgi:pterin-4a-carbinolamine dehydratase
VTPYREKLSNLGFRWPVEAPEPAAKPEPTADELIAAHAEQTAALGRLAKLSTVKDSTGPTSVKTQELFRRPRAAVHVPLNVKTTQYERKTVPLDQLEPTQDKIPVEGLRAYIKSSRRDPPDVLHVVMANGTERYIIQEGHTRLGVAVLKGQTTAEAKVWEFVQNAQGDLEPVPRGLQKRGLERAAKLSYREKLTLLLADDLHPDWQLSREGLVRRFDFPDRRQSASFLAALFMDANEHNHHPAVTLDDTRVIVTWCTHAEDDSVTDLDWEAAKRTDQLLLAADREEVINLPDISDVSFPSMIGAIPSKPPRKKSKPVTYKGVRLSRRPMKFEAQILALAEIPPRLDSAVLNLTNRPDLTVTVMQEIADYGAEQVLHELVRQGAPASILDRPPIVDVTACASRLVADRTLELEKALAYVEARVSRRHLSADRHKQIVRLLYDRREPRIMRRFADQAVNVAFTFGRATTIAAAQRPRAISLAKHSVRDDEGNFISIVEAVNQGIIAVDVVVQTAVMDTATCDECAEVDGEEMELGDDRQRELHPPYVKCLGEDKCRCVQIAILENGMEINVDEIDEDTIE